MSPWWDLRSLSALLEEGDCLRQHRLLGMPGAAVLGDGSASGVILGHLHIDSDLPQRGIRNSWFILLF